MSKNFFILTPHVIIRVLEKLSNHAVHPYRYSAASATSFYSMPYQVNRIGDQMR